MDDSPGLRGKRRGCGVEPVERASYAVVGSAAFLARGVRRLGLAACSQLRRSRLESRSTDRRSP